MLYVDCLAPAINKRRTNPKTPACMKLIKYTASSQKWVVKKEYEKRVMRNMDATQIFTSPGKNIK